MTEQPTALNTRSRLQVPSSSQRSPSTPFIQTVNTDIQNVEAQVKKLRSEIIDVTEALSLRTARSTKLTVAHADTTEALSRHAVTSVTKLRQTVDTFVKDVHELRARLDTLATLASQTSEVRSALTVLEVQVTRLLAAHRAKEAAATPHPAPRLQQ